MTTQTIGIGSPSCWPGMSSCRTTLPGPIHLGLTVRLTPPRGPLWNFVGKNFLQTITGCARSKLRRGCFTVVFLILESTWSALAFLACSSADCRFVKSRANWSCWRSIGSWRCWRSSSSVSSACRPKAHWILLYPLLYSVEFTAAVASARLISGSWSGEEAWILEAVSFTSWWPRSTSPWAQDSWSGG